MQALAAYIPIIVSAVLGFMAFYFNPSAFEENLWICYIVAITSSLVGVVGTFVIRIALARVLQWVICISAHVTFMIVTFAGIYRGYGIVGSESDVPGQYIVNDAFSAIYFSIVTWTTLGYGDFQPQEGIRLIAAMEAFIGYLFLGLLVAILSNSFLNGDD